MDFMAIKVKVNLFAPIYLIKPWVL
jgi:hypothetical protein